MEFNELITSNSLTADLVSLLNKQDMFTVIDFVKKDNYKLAQITNLDLIAVEKLKNDFFDLLNPYKGFGFERQMIETGIGSFDELLGGGLKSGNLYDICGLSASGKTQMCNSIAINLAINYKYETLYVDAKNDFSGQRVYNMLNARNCSVIESGVIMNCIRCQPVYDAHEFLTIIRELPTYLDEHKQAKCLVVDSLPALWFPLLDSKKNGASLLCEATNLMQKIAFTHDLVILLVNIVTRRTEIDSDASDRSQQFKTKTTVALGKYWKPVPRQRFLLTRATVSNSQLTGQRIIEIVEREGKGKSCIVNITNKGVVQFYVNQLPISRGLNFFLYFLIFFNDAEHYSERKHVTALRKCEFTVV